MKKPKKVMRYCPFCKKHTEQKISLLSSGHKRGAMKKGSKERARLRGRARGSGNLGRWSKPAIASWKRKTKSTKKIVIIYMCQECKKSILQRRGLRAGKIQIEEKKKE